MVTRFERFIRAVESDAIFYPLQIVLVPVTVFLACVVLG